MLGVNKVHYGLCENDELRAQNPVVQMLVSAIHQGPVVRTPVNTNLGLNFNPGSFFLLSKALSGIIFSILFRVSNHQIVGKEN